MPVSCVSTQSAGVIILYGNSFECHESYKDNEGRLAIAVIENDLEKIIVDNIYAPCDPAAALILMGTVYDKLFEIMDRHEDAFIVMGGDFNACMDANVDSINRIMLGPSSSHESRSHKELSP